MFTLFTVASFVALVKFLFTIPGVTCFLSEKLCQDPLEKFFGCQRQHSGVYENPTVQEFCTNIQALHVVNSFCQNVSSSNCRGRGLDQMDKEKETMPLPKRKRKLYHHWLVYTCIWIKYYKRKVYIVTHFEIVCRVNCRIYIHSYNDWALFEYTVYVQIFEAHNFRGFRGFLAVREN